MSDGNGILIVGGYGHAGRLIVADMAPRYPDRVVVAGRNGNRARSCADSIGNGVRGMELDVTDEPAVDRALDGIGLVICCLDQRKPHLLRGAVERGLAYTDLSAELDFWITARRMHGDAVRTGARVLIGAGLVPGLAGVMAREAVTRTGAGGSVDVGVLLSVGDSFGPEALDWMLASAGRSFSIIENGRARRVRGMGDSRSMAFPFPFGVRTAHRFGIPDQVFYPETLGVHRAGSWLALEPGWIGSIASASVHAGLARALRGARVRRAITRVFAALQERFSGSDAYALTVEADGSRGTARLRLVHRNESHGTASSAAIMADALVADGSISPGVWLPEQVFEPGPFFAALETRGITVHHHHDHGWNAADAAAVKR
jgi:saccharopine dehydrogenase (NAD+, L-lysine forming)